MKRSLFDYREMHVSEPLCIFDDTEGMTLSPPFDGRHP